MSSPIALQDHRARRGRRNIISFFRAAGETPSTFDLLDGDRVHVTFGHSVRFGAGAPSVALFPKRF